MQTFSQLRAIDWVLPITITLMPINNPDIKVAVSGKSLFDGCLPCEKHLISSIDLLGSLSIEIALRNKNYHGPEQAVIVSLITVDGKDHTKTLIEHADYANDHGFVQPTSYLGFNGSWKLQIDMPFYRWLHIETGQGWLLDPGI